MFIWQLWPHIWLEQEPYQHAHQGWLHFLLHLTTISPTPHPTELPLTAADLTECIQRLTELTNELTLSFTGHTKSLMERIRLTASPFTEWLTVQYFRERRAFSCQNSRTREFYLAYIWTRSLFVKWINDLSVLPLYYFTEIFFSL